MVVALPFDFLEPAVVREALETFGAIFLFEEEGVGAGAVEIYPSRYEANW